MRILGIDVCTGFCSVAILDAATVEAELHEPMIRGHAERLAPMVSEALAASRLNPSDLDAIAVTTGPGSFTGARLGVSLARGLALSLDIPAVGLSVFDMLAEAQGGPGPLVVVLEGKQGSLHLQVFANGESTVDPIALDAEEGWRHAPSERFGIIGSGGETFLRHAPIEVATRATLLHLDPPTAATVARAAARRLGEGTAVPPAPLYLRAPDAKPQAVVSLG